MPRTQLGYLSDGQSRISVVSTSWLNCRKVAGEPSERPYCKMPTASRGCDNSVTISTCPRRYDVCRMVDSNLEVMCLTIIRLHCRTNHCPSNMGSGLELSIISSYTKLHALGVPDLRYHITSSYPVLPAI